MARPKKKRGTSSSFDLSNLVSVFPELARKVKDRFSVLSQDVKEKLHEMEQLSEHHVRLVGKALLGRDGKTSNKPGPKADASGKGRKRRKRMKGVTSEWLTTTLKKPMTVKQLQDAASKAGLSGLRIPALLKEGRFKSAAGEKQANVKGKTAAVWSVR